MMKTLLLSLLMMMASSLAHADESKGLHSLSADLIQEELTQLFKSSVTSMHSEEPESVYYYDYGDGLSYGYVKMGNRQYLRIIAINGISRKHYSLVYKLNELIDPRLDLMLSMKSAGGTQDVYELFSEVLHNKYANNNQAKISVHIAPTDFCASACVGLMASIAQIGDVILFESEKGHPTCEVSPHIMIHAATLHTQILGYRRSRLSPEHSRSYNIGMGINKDWYEANLEGFSNIEFTYLSHQDLAGSGVITRTSSNMEPILKTPQLPWDMINLSNENGVEAIELRSLYRRIKANTQNSEAVKFKIKHMTQNQFKNLDENTFIVTGCPELDPDIHNFSHYLSSHEPMRTRVYQVFSSK